MNPKDKTSSEEKLSFDAKLAKELNQLMDEGGFIAATISDDKGLVLATKGNRILTDTISALSSASLQYKNAVQKEAGLVEIDEVTCVSGNKARYINRFFEINSHLFVLSAISPPHASYRKITNQAVISIQRIIKERLSDSIL
ncbi:MAG: hypothetical protein H6627_05780 [Calditrichae bacterium]|nr:hypothetical protein [Calditrichota bacterium]MCB9058056.1 hypothetical protein [Calditrichia bacterium]